MNKKLLENITLEEWNDTDGYEYILCSNGFVGRREIGSFGNYRKVIFNWTLMAYKEKILSSCVRDESVELSEEEEKRFYKKAFETKILCPKHTKN
jgi:hypothetical protein